MSQSRSPVRGTPSKSPTPSALNKNSKFPTGFGYGHIGTATKVREYEDRHFFGSIRTAGGLNLTLALVADGVGGGNLGQRAAQLTVDTIVDFCKSHTGTDILQMMGKAIGEANRYVFDEGQSSPGKNEMSSTVAFAVIHNNRLYIANVGDSRIYLVRDKRAQQITVDHSWANEQIREGKLSSSEANRHPNAGFLARSVGHEPRVRVDLGLYLNGLKDTKEEALSRQGLLLTSKDVLLVCSDGLIKTRRDAQGHFVESREILDVAEGGTAEQAAKTLVDIAIGRNADDNVTAVVVTMPGRKKTLRSRLPRVQIGTPAAIIIGVAICLVFTGALLWATRLVAKTDPLPTPIPGSATLVEGNLVNIADGTTLESGAALLFGVGTTLRAEQGLAILNLPGNYQLQLYGTADAPTEIKLISDANLKASPPRDETTIELQKGKLAVLKAPGTDKSMKVTILTPSGNATSKFGNVGVIYQVEGSRLQVDCFETECQVQVGKLQEGGIIKILAAKQSFIIDSSNTIQMPEFTDFFAYQGFNIPGILTEIPSELTPSGLPVNTVPLPPTVEPSRTPNLDYKSPTPTKEDPFIPTHTAIPPTNTPIPPTNTPAPPTNTPAPPPTETPMPTDTSVPGVTMESGPHH